MANIIDFDAPTAAGGPAPVSPKLGYAAVAAASTRARLEEVDPWRNKAIATRLSPWSPKHK